jgi:hypothetical protein
MQREVMPTANGNASDFVMDVHCQVKIEKDRRGSDQEAGLEDLFVF